MAISGKKKIRSLLIRIKRVFKKLFLIFFLTAALYSVAEVATRVLTPPMLIDEAIRARALWVLMTPDFINLDRNTLDFMQYNHPTDKIHMPGFRGKIRNPLYDSAKLREVMSFDVTINTSGFRGPPLSFKKEENEFRIVCLGDSWTFGWGVNNDQPFCNILQDRLQHQNPSRPIRAFNLGITATNIDDALNIYNSVGVRLKPDVVVYCGIINDSYAAFNRRIKKRWATLPFLQAMNMSRFAQLVKRKVKGPVQEAPPQALIEYENHLLKVLHYFEKAGANMVLVDQYLPVPLPGFKHFRHTFDRAAELSEFPFINVERTFGLSSLDEKTIQELKERPNWSWDFDDLFTTEDDKDWIMSHWYLFQDLSHPNDVGHKILGEKLTEIIQPMLGLGP